MGNLNVMDIITPTNKGYNVKKVINRGATMERDQHYSKYDNVFPDGVLFESNRKKEPEVHDCIIVGGGIAGLQAAIQLGRYCHKVLVIDSNYGRSNLCHAYHNILGWPDGISGPFLRETGKSQAEQLGVKFIEEEIVRIEKGGKQFILHSKASSTFYAKRILIATGVMDRLPPFPNLYPCLGISVYVCPDCDGYEVKDKRALVLGSGNVGANMALTLTYWTDDLIYINHEKATIDAIILKQLKDKNIKLYQEAIKEVIADGSTIQGVHLENGEKIAANRAFVAFGGNEVHSSIVKELGVKLHQNKHILVDPRTKMTNIEHVWAAGDVVAHSEQVTIALGEGMQAAIWIHKSLLKEGMEEL
ncbi:NAD(P)/FAD-dependent oxidoreductase [Heyndrickxia camelliae]|nr:NAD(P)/FAD-dependent oxidoreductase [Heyndrickxia camelliae]